MLLEEGDLVVDADGCDQGDDDASGIQVAKGQSAAPLYNEYKKAYPGTGKRQTRRNGQLLGRSSGDTQAIKMYSPKNWKRRKERAIVSEIPFVN